MSLRHSSWFSCAPHYTFCPQPLLNFRVIIPPTYIKTFNPRPFATGAKEAPFIVVLQRAITLKLMGA